MLVGLSNAVGVVFGGVAASRDACASGRVGEFGFSEEFLRIGFVVLAFRDALLACAVAGLAAVESEKAQAAVFSVQLVVGAIWLHDISIAGTFTFRE